MPISLQIVTLASVLLALASCVWQTDYEQLAGEKARLDRETESLASEVQRRTAEAQGLQARLEQLNRAMRATDIEIRSRSSDLARTRAALLSREEEITSLEQRIDRLSTSLATLRQRTEAGEIEAQTAIDQHLRTIASLRVERDAARSSIAQLEMALARAKQAETVVAEQQQAIETLEARVAELAGTETSLRSQNQLLGQKVAELEDAATRQTEQAATAAARQRAAIETLETRVAELAGTETSLRGQNQLLGQKVAELEDAAQALVVKRTQLTADLAALEGALGKRDLRITELETTNVDLASAAGELRAQLAAVTTERDATATEIQQVESALVETAAAKEQAVATLSVREKELTEQITALTADRDQHRRASADSEAKALLSRERAAREETRASGLEEKNRAAEIQLTALGTTAEKLEQELASQRATIESLEKRLAERQAPETGTDSGITTGSVEEMIRQQSFEGQIVYNPPRQMTVGETERVEVRIGTADENRMDEGFAGSGSPVTHRTEISTFMKVTLKGNNFEVDARSEAEQMVRQTGFSQWDFDVLPLKGGAQTLELRISRRVVIPGLPEQKVDLPALTTDIAVKVNPVYTTTSFLERHWQWIVGTILGSGFIGWVYARIRARRKA